MTDYHFTTMQDLVDASVEAYDGIVAVYPLSRGFNGQPNESALDLGGIAENHEHAYSIRYVVCAYVYEGKLYAIPWTKGVEKVLVANGFKRDFFYVPFSNDFSYPLKYAELWNNLVDLAREIRKVEGSFD